MLYVYSFLFNSEGVLLTMNIVLLGLGLQGKAALYDLVRFGSFKQITVVDVSEKSLEWVSNEFDDPRVAPCMLDLNNPDTLTKKLSELGSGIVVDLLPIQFIPKMARTAIAEGWHYVNTYYTLPELRELDESAKSKELSILPEFGFDPGIDLVLAGDACNQLDEITEYISYGGGIPEPAACDNPLNYKITWTFEGVLNSYYRPAKLIREGKICDISPDEIFSRENTHTVDVSGLGTLEAFPNGDATKYVEIIGAQNIKRAGRFAMRWPGHCQFWYTLSKLGLLEEKDVTIDGTTLNQRKMLARLLEEKLQYKDNERDIAVLRVEVAGRKDGKNKRFVYEMIDYRDLDTGLMAMNRTVGFTAAIGAQMIAEGSISTSGLLNPMTDVPYEPFVAHLKKRNIKITDNQ